MSSNGMLILLLIIFSIEGLYSMAGQEVNIHIKFAGKIVHSRSQDLDVVRVFQNSRYPTQKMSCAIVKPLKFKALTFDSCSL